MLSLTNKRILLGITGGIAAYKSAELTRLLVKAGAEVHVAMTPSATEFITPLTLQALSGNRVHLDLLDAEAEAGMGHIELARWADLIVIAPATADFMARMSHGQADDLLTAVILASTAQIAIAPAMNQAMWADGITQSNLEALQHRRIHVWGPASGEQACGDVGPGRMIEPQEIADRCAGMFETTRLTGKKVLITGGPTREAIDPVRFISNHSSGKMAFALAAAAAAVDAGVLLVIDYALEAQRYYTARRSDGTLMAVCAQQAGLSPFDQPGEQDLTAHLCIEVVDEAAQRNGWLVGDQAKQGEALLALGLAHRLHGLQQLPGQHLAEALQRREALLRLVDPAGLGAFRWLTYRRGLPEGGFSLSGASGSSESRRD